MPPDFLDAFTSIDNLLKQLIQESQYYNTRLIDKLAEYTEAITGITLPEEPDIPVNYVPFYSEGSLDVDTPVTLLVKDDDEQGLGAPGRSGYIINDGAGSIYITIDDGRVGKSKEIRVDNGEWLNIAREDEIWVDKLTLRTTVDDTEYRCLFSR